MLPLCGLGNNSNKGVLCILQSSSITGASPSDCFVSYQDTHCKSLTPLQRCSWCILQPQPTGPHNFEASFLTEDDAYNTCIGPCGAASGNMNDLFIYQTLVCTPPSRVSYIWSPPTPSTDSSTKLIFFWVLPTNLNIWSPKFHHFQKWTTQIRILKMAW